jgi:hypothetical protein
VKWEWWLMSHIDMFYWKLAILCCLVGVVFFFITAESLVQGKLRIPAWVFSSFTLVIGVFFFRIFVNSLSEFHMGQHVSLDQLMDTWRLVLSYIT